MYLYAAQLDWSYYTRLLRLDKRQARVFLTGCTALPNHGKMEQQAD